MKKEEYWMTDKGKSELEHTAEIKKAIDSTYKKIGAIQDSDDYEIDSPMTAKESRLWELVVKYESDFISACEKYNQNEKAYYEGRK